MALEKYHPLKQSLMEILNMQPNRGFSDMDEVYPGIFVGGVEAAKNAEKLKHLGVTHVVNSSHTHKSTLHAAFGVNTSEDFYTDRGLLCKFLGLPAMDVSGFKINQYFDTTSDFIHSAIESNGKVLVHCVQGVSRSATLVLAYLMIKQNMTAPDALKTVRSKRPIHPNDGFLDQLCHLELRLRAPNNNICPEDELRS